MKDKLTELHTVMNKTVFTDQKFLEKNKIYVRNAIQRKKVKSNWFPNFLTFAFILSFLVVGTYFIDKELNIFNLSFLESTNSMKTITDKNTKSEVDLVVPPENSLLINWGFDNMDRGNHDYNTLAHSELVVDIGYSVISRGDVVFFNLPKFTSINPDINLPPDYIARVVGLPGETIEIKDGQVFIDDKKLDTFYSKALMTGMDEDEYFQNVNPANIVNKEAIREHFALTMEPVKIKEHTIFVLVDNWSRGVDSKEFGVLPTGNIEGKIMGYKK